MGAAFLQTSGRVRAALWAGAAAIALLVVALAADAVAGLGTASTSLERWSPPIAALIAAAGGLVRVTTVERERRAWTPLAAGLAGYAVAWVAWTAVWAGDPDASIATPADALWLSFYPAAYATVAMLLRRSFVRAPASMWLDGLLAATAFSAVGIALIYAPIIHRVDGRRSASPSTPLPLGDLLLAALVLGIIAMSGWRPGVRWPVLGSAMLLWFIADTINLNAVVGGSATGTPAGDLFWCLGLLLLLAAPWQRPDAPEGLRVEGVRMLLAPAIFAVVALSVLAYDQLHPTNTVTVALALGAVAIALARTTMTLREVQMLADARHESLTDELTGLPNRRHFQRRLAARCARRRPSSLPSRCCWSTSTGSRASTTRSATTPATRCSRLVGRACATRSRDGDLLARLGGDEFAVLLPGGRGPDAARGSAASCAPRIEQPFEVAGIRSTSAPASASRSTPSTARRDELLQPRRRRHVPGQGAPAAAWRCTRPSRPAHPRPARAWSAAARGARSRRAGDLLPAQGRRSRGPRLGVEALVRWQHPVHGLLMPPDFLPLALRSGLMGPLTRPCSTAR